MYDGEEGFVVVCFELVEEFVGEVMCCFVWEVFEFEWSLFVKNFDVLLKVWVFFWEDDGWCMEGCVVVCMESFCECCDWGGEVLWCVGDIVWRGVEWC